jgi:hypothetical protein
VGKVVQPLQSVNYHDSHLMVLINMDLSHDYWGMVGLGLVESWVLIDFGCRGETCELCLVWLQG